MYIDIELEVNPALIQWDFFSTPINMLVNIWSSWCLILKSVFNKVFDMKVDKRASKFLKILYL